MILEADTRHLPESPPPGSTLLRGMLEDLELRDDAHNAEHGKRRPRGHDGPCRGTDDSKSPWSRRAERDAGKGPTRSPLRPTPDDRPGWPCSPPRTIQPGHRPAEPTQIDEGHHPGPLRPDPGDPPLRPAAPIQPAEGGPSPTLPRPPPALRDVDRPNLPLLHAKSAGTAFQPATLTRPAVLSARPVRRLDQARPRCGAGDAPSPDEDHSGDAITPTLRPARPGSDTPSPPHRRPWTPHPAGAAPVGRVVEPPTAVAKATCSAYSRCSAPSRLPHPATPLRAANLPELPATLHQVRRGPPRRPRAEPMPLPSPTHAKSTTGSAISPNAQLVTDARSAATSVPQAGRGRRPEATRREGRGMRSRSELASDRGAFFTGPTRAEPEDDDLAPPEGRAKPERLNKR